MGKIVSNFFISLDGVVESPEKWHFPYFNDEMGAAVQRGMDTNEAFLMGRVLYEQWAAYWPQSEDDLASFMNNHPKFVVSNSLRNVSWKNTTLIAGDVARQITDLKERIDGDIVMSGSARTVRWLLQNSLLDELNLMIHPIAVGSGQRLFEDGHTYPLELIKSEKFKSGVLNLTYIPLKG